MVDNYNTQTASLIKDIIKNLKREGFSQYDIINYLNSLKIIIDEYRMILMKESIIEKLSEFNCDEFNVTENDGLVLIECSNSFLLLRLTLQQPNPDKVELLVKPKTHESELIKFLNEHMVMKGDWYYLTTMFDSIISFLGLLNRKCGL